MPRKQIVICLTLLAMLASLLTVAASPVAAQEKDQPAFVADQALVGITRGDFSEASNSIENYGGDVLDYFDTSKVVVVDTPGQATDWVARFQEAVKRWDFLKFVELDYIVHAESHGDTSLPNDPRWSSLYGMQKIGVEEAWHGNTGSKNVVVGVIDSGVDYTHPDLASQMWVNTAEIAGNGIDDDANGWKDDVHGVDCANNDGNPMDDNDHGTHVSGTIAGTTNNGIGVAGVADVSIMALKFLSASGSGSTSNAIECLEYAIKMGADLTSNSWGGGGFDQGLYDTIKKAGTQANQLFIAAAGNDSSNTDSSPHYPSSYNLDNLISVAATDSNDNLASFSNYGATSVDLGAPGVGTWSTVPGNGYASFSGTSMATPHVAGAAALLLSQYPSDTYATLRDRIYSNVTKISALTNKSVTEGRLNIAGAMTPDLIAPDAPAITSTSSAATSVTLNWTAPGDDGATGGPASSYQLRYRPVGASGWATAPSPTPALPGTAQSATVRGLVPGTAYNFSLTATDNGGNVSAAGETNATTGNAAVPFADDMEGGSSKWTATSPWAISTEQPQSPQNSWSDSPGGSYANNRDVSVTSTSFNLSGVTDPKLSFWHRYSLELDWDYAYVYCSSDGGSTWTQLVRYTGAASYQPVELSLSSCAGSSNVRLRFRITTDTSVLDDGWYFDDVVVSGVLPEPDTTAPPAPTGLTATAGTSQVTLDWSDVGASDLAGHRVYRTTDTSSWPSTPIATRTQSNYTDTDVTAGTTYHYRVTAYDTSNNESGASSPATAAVPEPDTTAPPAPTGLTATAGTSQVTLDWSDVGASDLAGYRVYRTTDTSSWSSTPIATRTESNYTDTGLAAGTTYHYRVTAYDSSSNESPASDPASATTPVAVQEKSFVPSSVTIMKGVYYSGSVANLATDNGSYYRVSSRSDGSAYYTDWYGESIVDVTGVNKLTLTYNGRVSSSSATQNLYVKNFATGDWQRFSNATGSSSDRTMTWSTTTPAPYISGTNEVRLRVESVRSSSHYSYGDLIRFDVEYGGAVPPPDTTGPAAPTNLAATDGVNRVTLDWSDNGEADLGGYRVFRTTDGVSWNQVGTSSASNFTDTTAVAGTTYSYRVIAYDIFNNESAPSNEDSARSNQQKSFVPSSVSILSGAYYSGTVSNLATDNGSYYRVSARSNGTAYFTDWYGQSIIDVSGVSRLTLTYNGRVSSSSATQRLYVQNFDTGLWEQFSSLTGSSSDRTVTWSTTNPDPYISASNELRLRVESQRSSSHYSYGDLIRFDVEY